mmetsp:Transcript_4467/g.8793  ORF Transcript_4467/g.8793 Transcript_4467/m.8793 type:complete len:681 (-) Transcript_4467:301-2343(-)
MTASTSRQSTGRRRRGAYVYLDRLRNSLDSSPIINRTDAMESGHRNGSPQSRLGNRNIGYLFHTTFVMLTIFAFAGAMHHAAFVTRLSGGQGLSRVSLTNYPINCCWEMKSKASRNIPSKNFFGSLLMSSRSSASDTEVERDEKSGFDDEDEWRTILAAFQMYKAAYGDLKVPSRFVVPAMAPWPEPAWRLKLGQRVAAIRSTGKYVQNNEGRRKVLDDMGFLWRLRAPSPDKKLDGVAFDQVYDALKTYREVLQPKGKLDVPSTYVVPDCEPWPVSTRGLPLGKILPTVRSKAYLKSHPDAEAKLNSLGFGPDSKAAANDVRYQRVYDALVKYKELYGDLLVPQPFTVPEDSDEWPEEVRGLRLGARVNAIRSQGTFVKTDPSRKEELDALGFVWEPPANADGKRRGRKKKSETDEGYEDDESNNGDDDDDDDDDNATAATSRTAASTVVEGGGVFCLNRRQTWTISVYLMSLLPSLLVSDIGPVLSLTGAIGGSCISYIGPGLLYLGINGEEFLSKISGAIESWRRNKGYATSSSGANVNNNGSDRGSVTADDLPVEGDADAQLPPQNDVSPTARSYESIHTGPKPCWYYLGLFPFWCAIARKGAIHTNKKIDAAVAAFGRGGVATTPDDGAVDVLPTPSKWDFTVSIIFVLFGVVSLIAGVGSNIYVQLNGMGAVGV